MADLVTLAEAKIYLQIGHEDDDDLLNQLIDGFTAGIEKYTGRSFTESTVVDYIDGGNEDLIVRTPPIATLTKIEDTFDDDEVVNSDDYDFDPDAGHIYYSQDATVSLIFGARGKWGLGRRRWRVTYEGGFNGAPADVKQATLLLVAARHNRRDALQAEKLGDYSYSGGDKWSDEVTGLLDPYKLITF